MKKCKSCQSEIDAKAKKCPHCQTDQRNWFLRHPILTFFLVLFIFGIVSIAMGGDENTLKTSSNSSGSQAVNADAETYAIGQAISADELEITVTSIEQRAQVGGEFLNETPSEGGTLIAVDWSYKNVSDKPVGSFSQPSVKLIDSKGTEYDWDLGKSSTYATEKKLDSKVMSDLNPGITVRDAKVFEVSKEMYEQGGWKLLIRADGKSYQIAL